MTQTAIGIDIGGTKLRAARVDADGRVLCHRSEAITRDPEAVLARIVDLCREFGGAGIKAVGIGIPGRVDYDRQEVLSGGFIDLGGRDVARRLEAALTTAVTIDNDCSMALVAEMALGAAAGHGNVVMFTIGTGIGGAIALSGHLAHGSGTAGQLGHITVEPEGPVCNCGRRGCVETTSSGTALARLTAEAGLAPGLRAEDLLRAAERGDPASTQVVERWIWPLRRAIDTTVATVAPDIVLLGGGLGQAAKAALDHAPAVSPWYQCPVEAARLGDEAGVVGAALAALSHIRSRSAGASA